MQLNDCISFFITCDWLKFFDSRLLEFYPILCTCFINFHLIALLKYIINMENATQW